MKVELKAGDSLQIPEGCKAVIKDNVVVFEKEEKEEVLEFKDGDVLTSKMGVVLIFKNDDGCGQFTSHYNTANFPNSFWLTSLFRHATEEEKQTLYDKMKAQGLRWNAEEKKVEKIRWRAKDGKEYYYVGNQGIIMVDREDGVCANQNRHEFNNYFRTYEQAEEAAKRVKDVLCKYHEEIGE